MAIQKADCSNFVISFAAGLTDDRCLRWLYDICLKGFVLKSYKAKLGSKIKIIIINVLILQLSFLFLL